jgi:Fimbrial assembly protein (PilN)
MADFDLNLSTQAFPAYRLVNTALVCVLIILAIVSVWQAAGFVRYSDMARSIRGVEKDNRVEAEALGKRVAELESRLDRPESTAKLNEIGFLNHLILRKSFSWTKLFNVLEQIVPENVHFTSLAPNIDADGGVTLSLGVRARSMGDMTQFVRRLEDSPLFENVVVRVEEKIDQAKGAAAKSDLEVTLSTVYYPQKDSQ